MRLRRWDPSGPAVRRVRRGRGFGYLDADGTPTRDPGTRARIHELVIPPAWQDVRICPWPNGHLQAVGVDDAGRLQYLYHPVWRERRDREKFDRTREFGRQLPAARQRIADDLRGRGLNRRRVLALAARLLDVGLFRIGGERYQDENGSYGLATVRREHVRLRRGPVMVFQYPAKSGQERVHEVDDPQAVTVVRSLLRRNDPTPTLLAFFERRAWHNVGSADINDYLHELFDDEISAKDFRTWHATVLAAACLAEGTAERAPTSAAARRRAEAAALRQVAESLGNTLAVCRASYVDPAVLEAFSEGRTVRPGLPQEALEPAVLRLLDAR